jgi:outer membrane protein assembly factor BamD
MRSVAAILKTLALVSVLAIGAISVSGCASNPKDEDETVKWSPEKLYGEAKESMNDGAYDRAIKMFERLESRYPYGRYAQQAQLEVAYAHFRMQEPESAIADCDRFIRLHPNHPSVDYAYYLKGLANFNDDIGIMGYVSQQDQTERDPKSAQDAFDAFRALVNRFPTSKYAEDSVFRMKYLVNSLAAHEVHVARYYLARGATVAAVNRAQTALTSYPDAPANEEALFVMIKAYDMMNMKDLRDDTERVMRKNFPKSRYFERGFGRDEPWWKLW